ncbi:MAG: putative FmdB family regulatory protein [Candidatus Promineifilaceae bacterium]|jgi:putative FmdB family regulatory protein
MPIYEYAAKGAKQSCAHCKTGFETLQNLSEDSLTRCPECGNPVAKQISAPNVGASEAGFDDRAKSAGFQKLKRVSKGEYEKMY